MSTNEPTIKKIKLYEIKNNIVQVFYALNHFDDELIPEDITWICTHEAHLYEILAHPKEYGESIIGLCKMLNTEQTEKVDSLRKQTLADLIEITNVTDFDPTSVLVVPAYKIELIEEITNFYNSYDLNDFKHEKLGWGQTDKESLTADGNLTYKHIDMNPIFRDLHCLTFRLETPMQFKRDAWNLIDSLREYYEDPIDDAITVGFAKPLEPLTYRKMENRFESLRTELKVDDVVLKSLGDGLFVAFDKNAKELQKPKNRKLYLENGTSGIARGNIIFFAMDYKGNMDGFDMHQYDIISDKYFEPHYFKGDNGMPISNLKAQKTLQYLIVMLNSTTNGKNLLKSSGLTEKEIENTLTLLE